MGSRSPQRSATLRPIPTGAGIGLRTCHQAEVLRDWPQVAWFEAHAENYFARGGALPGILEQIRSNYPLSFHGVGLGLGNTDPVDGAHLAALRRLVDRYEPALVSEHLCWGASGGRFTNDLLPMPYTEEALTHLSARMRQLQDVLGRQILIENVSSYLQFCGAEYREWEFIVALATESGCGILLDVNNVYVSAMNHGFDALRYLEWMPRHLVQEIHLAGHTIYEHEGRHFGIDTHSTRVCDAVWDLYRRAVQRLGAVPTLIEWDVDIPALHVLQHEAARADAIIKDVYAVAA